MVKLLSVPAIALAALVGAGCQCAEEPSTHEAVGSAGATTTPADAAGAGPLGADARPEADAPDAHLAPPRERDRAESITIVAGGDVNLARGLGQIIMKDADYDPFREIAPVWRDADLRFVNLESQLSHQNGETQSPNNRLVFTGPPGGAKTLENAGVGVVSLANNHAWDYGKGALRETLENLDAAGVKHVGASMKRGDSAYEPTLVEVKGWKIAFFAVTAIWNQGPIESHEGRYHVAWARFDKLAEPFRKARKENDLVFVSYHGGSEYVDVPMRWSDEFVRAIMDHGADAMIGHHPHVPQGVAWYGDRPVLYSLGNFVFAMHRDYQWTGIGMLAKMTFHRSGELETSICPFHIFGHTPMRFESKGERAQKGLETVFTRHLRRLSRATGGSFIGEPGEHSCVEVRPPERRRDPWLYPPSKRVKRESTQKTR